MLMLSAVQALAKYAFGLGTVTMVACTLVFTGMSLPPGQGLGTQIMVKVSASLLRICLSRCKCSLHSRTHCRSPAVGQGCK